MSIYESKLGLSPWDVLNQGVAKHTPLSFGTANIAIALVILVVARKLDVRPQIGTARERPAGRDVRRPAACGSTPCRQLAHDALPVRIVLLVGGILVIGLGTGLYIGAHLGAGPRDSLMLGITRRVRSRVGVVRTGLEVAATAVGFALGGTVGHRHARVRARDRPRGRAVVRAARALGARRRGESSCAAAPGVA